MKRCRWVDLKSQLYIDYHDHEWGVASYDDAYLFEMLVLEMFQAGLSWLTILKKREGFREAFDGFDVVKVSEYDDLKVEELMGNDEIIRNRRKIKAAIQNAKVFMDIQKEKGSFSTYIWSFTGGRIIYNQLEEVQTTSSLSDEISKDLRKRGMSFVGSTIVYSYLQAIGVLCDHELDCDWWKNF